MQLRRILVPVDFSAAATKALQYAAAFAREYKALITSLHVVEPDGSLVRRNTSRQRLIEEMSEVGEDQLRKLVDVIWGEEISTDIVVATGKPYLQIVNEAKEMNSDMIILASHGVVGTWGLFRRNTTTRVVRYAPCPVLVVQTFASGLVMNASVERYPGR
jgi:nucleotide-binding universal stress UspA family protein